MFIKYLLFTALLCLMSGCHEGATTNYYAKVIGKIEHGHTIVKPMGAYNLVSNENEAITPGNSDDKEKDTVKADLTDASGESKDEEKEEKEDETKKSDFLDPMLEESEKILERAKAIREKYND